jgi:hypothetical protein
VSALSLYASNSKYRISWECAELLLKLAGGSGASTAVNWDVGSAPPLEFPLPRPNEIMDVAGTADSGEEEEQGKSDHACRG